MGIEVKTFDAAEFLTDEATQLAFLDEALASDDPAFIARAIGAIARAKGGMLQLERLTGIKRQTLNKSLGPDGNPTLETLVPVLKALGIRLRVEHVPAQEREFAAA